MSISSDSSIRDKIAKLLALAESPNEHEAKLALLRARELMAKYKLRPEECQKAKNAKVVRGTIGITCTAMTNSWAPTLSAVIAESYCCRSYRTREHGRRTYTIGLVGLEEDFEICKRILLYAYDCIFSYCKHNIPKDPHEPSGTYRSRCNAYGWGFTHVVKKALEEQKEQNQEWGLVLVIPQAVDDSMKDMGKPSIFGRDKTTWDDFHYKAAGYQDGASFDPKHRIDPLVTDIKDGDE